MLNNNAVEALLEEAMAKREPKYERRRLMDWLQNELPETFTAEEIMEIVKEKVEVFLEVNHGR